MHAIDLALRFMEAINAHDVERIAGLMAEHHEFVDGLGQAITGREAAESAWRGYFGFCPDYAVSHEDVFCERDHVAIFGAAGGTLAAAGVLRPENSWRVTAAWLARIEGRLIARWQVFADNKPVYDILARLQAG